MACFKPLRAWQSADGLVLFTEGKNIVRELQLPCGRCIGCRLKRSRSWAIRCVHESQMHDSNSFITLTYDDDNFNPSLIYRDFQLFMKRLRKANDGKVRFFCCGEYGDETKRPHFHALLFGVDFVRSERIGKDLYRSVDLEALWPFGMSSFGAVTFQSAGYVARYCTKKVTGPRAQRAYERVDFDTGEVIDVAPEFGRMSLKPGIGYPWFEKYWKDVFLARDGVVMQGKTLPVPQYYDKLLERMDLKLKNDKEYDRYIKSKEFEEDCTTERLGVREIVAEARLKFNKRKVL